MTGQSYPSAGGLQAETVSYGHDNFGYPASTSGALSSYASYYAVGAFYDLDGSPSRSTWPPHPPTSPGPRSPTATTRPLAGLPPPASAAVGNQQHLDADHQLPAELTNESHDS